MRRSISKLFKEENEQYLSFYLNLAFLSFIPYHHLPS